MVTWGFFYVPQPGARRALLHFVQSSEAELLLALKAQQKTHGPTQLNGYCFCTDKPELFTVPCEMDANSYFWVRS